MIILRKNRRKYHFRDRMVEWVLSSGLVALGAVFLLNADILNGLGYEPLKALGTQIFWGLLCITIGGLRLGALTINGLWRPTAHLRAIGAALGTTIWGSLLTVSILYVELFSPRSVMYTMLLVFEFISLWFSARDAKLADSIAANGEGT